ncbi:MAG: nucleotide exchange factor GrpE [Deltaproteobacteria bacterium]|nr:MAG: nucleotide exchange factor GrpE [Deltaproteobacteria bacterium]
MMSDHKKKIQKKAETDKHGTDNKISTKKNLDKEKKGETADPLKEMETKIKSLEEEVKETYDRFLRVSAEFENYKKRSAREMSEFKKFANESLIKELLLVVDNMERAISSSKDEGNSNNALVEGIDMTLKELLKIFEKFGVKQVKSLEKPFDPNFHQAVMRQENDEHPHNTVINELQKGYLINKRLLRPATVVVSMSKEKK